MNVETVVLDAQGLTQLIDGDRKLMARLRVAREAGATAVISANTIVEVSHSRLSEPRLNWALSRVEVEPVTADSAKASARLLKAAGMHGHEHALDATVAEVALRQYGPTVVYTSDPDDMKRLCGDDIRIIVV